MRDRNDTDDARCEDACKQFDDLYGNGSVVSCMATGIDQGLSTWDPGQSSVSIACTLEGIDYASCTQ